MTNQDARDARDAFDARVKELRTQVIYQEFGEPSAHCYAEMPQNIASCEASIAASTIVIEQMAQALNGKQFEVTSGRSIAPEPVSRGATAPPCAGLSRVAADGERLGRLGWMPGAK